MDIVIVKRLGLQQLLLRHSQWLAPLEFTPVYNKIQENMEIYIENMHQHLKNYPIGKTHEEKVCLFDLLTSMYICHSCK